MPATTAMTAMPVMAKTTSVTKGECGTKGSKVTYSFNHKTGALTISGGGAIKTKAFYEWNDIKTVTIGKNVTEIGKSAFSRCTNLTTVNLGTGVKYIEDYAFLRCTKLATIKNGDNVKSVGANAFYKTEYAKTTKATIKTVTFDKSKHKADVIWTKAQNADGYDVIVTDRNITGFGYNSFTKKCSYSTTNCLKKSTKCIDIVIAPVKKLGKTYFELSNIYGSFKVNANGTCTVCPPPAEG